VAIFCHSCSKVQSVLPASRNEEVFFRVQIHLCTAFFRPPFDCCVDFAWMNLIVASFIQVKRKIEKERDEGRLDPGFMFTSGKRALHIKMIPSWMVGGPFQTERKRSPWFQTKRDLTGGGSEDSPF
jgi:hypothetical protein